MNRTSSRFRTSSKSVVTYTVSFCYLASVLISGSGL